MLICTKIKSIKKKKKRKFSVQEIIFKCSSNKRHYFSPIWYWGSNKIAMQLVSNSNWIQIKYNEWNLNSTIGLRFNSIQFNSNSIEKK